MATFPKLGDEAGIRGLPKLGDEAGIRGLPVTVCAGGLAKPPMLGCMSVGGTGGSLPNKLEITSKGRVP